MRLNEINYPDALTIAGYCPRFFSVGVQVHNRAVLCSTAGVSEWGGYSDSEKLLTQSWEVAVLFIGTGKDTPHTPAVFRVHW